MLSLCSPFEYLLVICSQGDDSSNKAILRFRCLSLQTLEFQAALCSVFKGQKLFLYITEEQVQKHYWFQSLFTGQRCNRHSFGVLPKFLSLIYLDNKDQDFAAQELNNFGDRQWKEKILCLSVSLHLQVSNYLQYRFEKRCCFSENKEWQAWRVTMPLT